MSDHHYSPRVHSVQPLDGGPELLLVEDGEDGEDVLLQQEVNGGLPVLPHSLSMEAWVDAHGNVRGLHLPGLDPPRID